MSGMMDLSFLTVQEKEQILKVLQRDEELKKEEDKRVRKLRFQLLELRQKGAIKSGSGDSTKTCARCRQSLGVVFCSGDICPKCQHKVCRNCKVFKSSENKTWLCVLCHKQRDVKGRTGEWFYEKSPQAKKSKVTATDIVLASLQKGDPHQGILRGQPHETPKEAEYPKSVESDSDVSRSRSESPEYSTQGSSPVRKTTGIPDDRSVLSDSSGRVDSTTESENPNLPEDPSPESHRPYEHYRVYDMKRRSSLDSEYSSSQMSVKSSGSVPNSRRMESPTTVSVSSDTDPRSRGGHYAYDNESDIAVESLHASDTPGSITSSVISNTTRGPADGADSERDKLSGHLASDLSDSEPEAVTEAMTGIAFHKMTLKPRQQSSPAVERHHLESVDEIGLSLADSRHSDVVSLDSMPYSQQRFVYSSGLPSNSPSLHSALFRNHNAHSSILSESHSQIYSDSVNDSSILLTAEFDRLSVERQQGVTAENSNVGPTNEFDGLSVPENESVGGLAISDKEEGKEAQNNPESKWKTKSGRVKLLFKWKASKMAIENDEEEKDIFEELFEKCVDGEEPWPPVAQIETKIGVRDPLKKKKDLLHARSDKDLELLASLGEKQIMRDIILSMGDEILLEYRKKQEGQEEESRTVQDAHDKARSLTLLEIAQSRSRQQKESNGSTIPAIEIDTISDSTGENEDIDKHFRPHSTSATASPARVSNLSTNTLGSYETIPVEHLYRPTLSLYGSVDSLTSFYSSAGERNFGKITVTGDVKFDMTYNYKIGVFEVKIIACRDLAPVDTRKNFSDPYVKTYLLPDKTKNGKRKTKVKKHTLNPHYDEVLKYIISESELQTRTLWISVWHNDAFGHNDFLGEIQLPLDDINFEEFAASWMPLSSRIAGTENTLSYKGDLAIALRIVYPDSPTGSPSGDIPKHVSKSKKKSKGGGDGMQGVLHVHIKEAKNLIAVRISGYSDPFAKCYLLPNRSRAGKRKTEVLRKNCNPKWDQMFVYEGVTKEDLKERALELTIWDRESVTSNDFLGGLRLGAGTGKSYGKDVKWQDSKPDEMNIWQRMLMNPNKWVEATLPLRSHMNGKEAKEAHYV